MKKGGFMKDALILFAITVVAGGCLGGVYEITKEPIERANQAAQIAAYQEVLPEAKKLLLLRKRSHLRATAMSISTARLLLWMPPETTLVMWYLPHLATVTAER